MTGNPWENLVNADAESTPGPLEPGPLEPGADETAQSELDLGVVSTGSATVDAALRPVEQLADREVAAHPDVFEEVLADLSRTMTADDSPPAQD